MPWRLFVIVLALGLLALGADGPRPAVGETPREVAADWHTLATPDLADGQFELLTLSTLPDAVTGGDALVAVRGLEQGAELTVTRDGVDVTDVFEPVGGDERHGLVTGLREGRNTLEARSGGQVATLVVRNHPITGPVISGPHQEPFFCTTEAAGLGEPLDDDCSAEPRYQWFYRSSENQGFHELADPYAPYPSDVMTTRTSDGRAVPFVARVESRTINRGIARLAVLDDPAARGPDAPFEAETWNRRVYYIYGESCGVGYTQGSSSPEMVLGGMNIAEIDADNLFINLLGVSDRLGKGDITVHSTLSAYGVHCNPVISIETTMMLREHITEQYGLIDAIVGTNSSGGALQQYNAANNAPGLLQAAMPGASFADIPSTAMTVTDCGLLENYYATTDLSWNVFQRAAVNGHNVLSGNDANAICQGWVDTFLDRIDPTTGCAVPSEMRYHPEERPDGVRCTVQEANVNIVGRDPETGFARRPVDNVGVQYGLNTLRDGIISFEQFTDLNRRIGGYDIDGGHMPERHRMSAEDVAIQYRYGGIVGRGALAETPIIDVAPYLDLVPIANIHESVRPFTVRDRLRVQTGQDASQSIWRGVLTQADVYPTMEEWFTAVEAARPGYGGDHVAAVGSAKPASAGDRCAFGTVGGRLELPHQILAPLGLAQLPLLPGAVDPSVDVPLRVDAPEDFDLGVGPCSVLLPVVATPRMVAGMPMSDDIIKCQLRPLDPGDYPAGLSDAQRAELEQIFPEGVCDYTRPAAEDVEASMIWTSFGTEAGDEPTELAWRVARSGLPTAADDDIAPPLPATGAAPIAALALLAGAAALRLAARRRT